MHSVFGSTYIVVAICVCYVSAYSCDCSGGCLASTTTGKYLGVQDSDGVHFLSIRYAKPPVGNLRFADPVPFVPSHNTTYGASSLPPFCIQYTTYQSEDCLFLNVFRPEYSKNGMPLPVMFWIHGGSFLVGGTSDPTIYGAHLAKAKKMIVVTVQYRLGLLGLFDDGLNTNFAVKDVILALKWVKNNIATFNGDPSRITIAGQSSGGTMIRALMATTDTAGIFGRAILMSDPMDYGFNKRSTSVDRITTMIYNATGCSDITCMRSLSLTEVLNAQVSVLSNGPRDYPEINYGQPFSPVIDGTLIEKDFSTYVEGGDLPIKVPMIVGTVAAEANSEVEAVISAPVPVTYYPTLLSQLLGAKRAALLLGTGRFLPNPLQDDSTRLELAFVGKLFYWTCAVQSIALSYFSNIYSKIYIYETEVGITYPTDADLSLCQGKYVCHQADIEPLFGTYDASSVTGRQIAVSQEIQERWYQFIKSGSPNGGSYVRWKPIGSTVRLNLLKIGEAKVVSRHFADKCGIIFGKLVNFDYQLYSQ
ncbi:Alpha/Beta hydrolase protein [Lipomyces kononenkoae]|uniref:Alpha/Beta hydrolase protein n=1 Tax=Lipomyces kononenkoae TaxID=34357 RepID=A0ACC3SVK4_LIPKO